MRLTPPLPWVLLLAAAAGHGGPSPGHSPSPHVPRPGSSARSEVMGPSGYAPGVPLPDSVYARIDGRQLITRRNFDLASARFGSPSDSLTPDARKRFLDLLIDQRVLATRVAREHFEWTVSESVAFVSLRDRLVLNAALDSAMQAFRGARAAHGADSLSGEALGIALRDSVVASMSPSWD